MKVTIDAMTNRNIEMDEQMKAWNEKILGVLSTINSQFPQLAKFLEESKEIEPNNEDKGITEKDLKEYYDSLNAMLNKYLLEHPELKK